MSKVFISYRQTDDELDYQEGVAAYTSNLASLAMDLEDWPGAQALTREALSVTEKIGHQELIAVNCLRLAQALVLQGKKAEATPYAQRGSYF